jgi:hypothetical protein
MTQVWPAVFKTVIIQRQKLEVGSFRIKNQSAPVVLWVIVIITEFAVTETSFWNSNKKIWESPRVIRVYETNKVTAWSRIILDKLLFSLKQNEPSFRTTVRTHYMSLIINP